MRQSEQLLAQIVRHLYENDYTLSIHNVISFSREYDERLLSSDDFEKEYKNCTFKHLN